MDILNIPIFFIYTLTLTLITFIVVKLGENWSASWFTLLIVLSNFFSLKQITLFHLQITTSDPLIISWVLGLNLFKEFFSKEKSKEVVNLAIVIAIIFSVATQFHLLLKPNLLDWSQPHFKAILSSSIRIVFSSIIVFFFLQKLDHFLFYLFKHILKNSSFTLRSTLSSIIIQLLYAIFFSYMAFYGLVENIWHLILMNFLTKFIMLIGLTPITHFMNRIIMKKNAINNKN